MLLFAVTECIENAHDIHHHFKYAVMLAVLLAMVADYVYMETFLPKFKKEHKKHAIVMTYAGYTLVEFIRALPEIAENLPKELVEISNHVDFVQLHEIVKLFLH